MLRREARNSFENLKGAWDSDLESYESTFVMPRASYCAIDEFKFECSWVYDVDPSQALPAYNEFVRAVEACLNPEGIRGRAVELQGKSRAVRFRVPSHADVKVSYSDRQSRITGKSRAAVRLSIDMPN